MLEIGLRERWTRAFEHAPVTREAIAGEESTRVEAPIDTKAARASRRDRAIGEITRARGAGRAGAEAAWRTEFTRMELRAAIVGV